MKKLETYSAPEAEILFYAAWEALCYDDSWARSSGSGSDGTGGIELPDDNWNGGTGNGEIELPDDNL